MDSLKVGIIHPGSMGTTLGMALQANGHEVLWASSGRSDETRARAESIGMRDVTTIVNMATEASVIFSIVTGGAVETMAHIVTQETEFSGLYIDCNHIDTNREATLRQILDDHPYVEASIDAYPIPHPHPGYTEERKILFSGERADEAVELIGGEIFDCATLDTSAKAHKHEVMAANLKYQQERVAEGVEVEAWVLRGLGIDVDVDE